MIAGYLRFMVMKALSNKKLSGYDIKKHIEKESGTYKPSFGSIYPLLEKLLKEGLCEFETKGRRKIYYLTKKGRSSLPAIENAKNKMADQMVATINAFGKLIDAKERGFMMEVFNSLKKGNLPFKELNPEISEFRATLFDAYSKGKNIAKIKVVLRRATKKIKSLK